MGAGVYCACTFDVARSHNWAKDHTKNRWPEPSAHPRLSALGWQKELAQRDLDVIRCWRPHGRRRWFVVVVYQCSWCCRGKKAWSPWVIRFRFQYVCSFECNIMDSIIHVYIYIFSTYWQVKVNHWKRYLCFECVWWVLWNVTEIAWLEPVSWESLVGRGTLDRMQWCSMRRWWDEKGRWVWFRMVQARAMLRSCTKGSKCFFWGYAWMVFRCTYSYICFMESLALTQDDGRMAICWLI